MGLFRLVVTGFDWLGLVLFGFGRFGLGLAVLSWLGLFWGVCLGCVLLGLGLLKLI